MNHIEDETLTLEKANKKARGIYILEAAFEYFVSIMMTGAFLAALLSRNGVPDWLVGIISSFISLTCIFQIFSASIVRKGSSVKRIIFLFTLANELIFAFLYIIPIFPISSGVKCALFVVLIFSAYVIYNLVNPLKFSWYMLFVKSGERGTFTAKKEIISLISGMAFSYLMGQVSDYFTDIGKSNLAFLLSAVTLFVVSGVHLALIFSTREHSIEVKNTGGAKNFFSSFKSLSNKTVLALIVLQILWSSTTHFANNFYGVYQTGDLGFTLRFCAVLSMIQAGVRAVVSPFMGRIADRYGWHKNLMICFSSAALSFLSMIFCVPENGAVMYILHNIFYGIAMSGINGGLMNIVFDYVPESERTATLGMKAGISGVFGFGVTAFAGMILKNIQESGVVLFEREIYAQQVLSLISFVLCVILIFYVALVIGRLKKNN